jgi:hypothetical protein
MSEKQIKDSVNELIASQAVQIERLLIIDEKLDRCIIGLNGAPDEPEKGMIVRVDRLEQSKKNLVRVLWVLFAALVGLVSNTFASFWKLP